MVTTTSSAPAAATDVDVRDYLASKGLQVKDAGPGEIHLACMFCDEDPRKRGRLYINAGPDPDTHGLFYCHKCTESGNLRTLMRHFGDDPGGQPAEVPMTGRVMLAACEYYQGLHDERSLSYLQGPTRSLTRETIRDFRLGYAPANYDAPDHLYRHLTDAGFDWDDIAATGLVSIGRDGEPRDFFQNKIVIPYLADGKVLQLRGKDASGKYLTPPGQKTRLFNGMAALRHKEVVVCEGEFDAMLLTQLGYHAAALPGAASMQREWADYFSGCDLILTLFDPDAAGEKGLEKFFNALPETTRDRVVNLTLPVPEGLDPGEVDPSWLVGNRDWGRDQFDALIDAALNADTVLVTVHEAFEEWASVQGLRGLQLGLGELDLALRPGLLPGQVMIPLAKAEPVTNLLPTPNGPRKMGELAVGDEVFGRDGRPTTVLGVYPQGERDCYRVTFADKSSVVVSGDHLWSVEYRSGKHREWTDAVMSTTELLEAGLVKGREYRFKVPLCAPLQYYSRAEDLPIEPYTLGSLIANGTLSSGTVTLTTPDEEVVERIRGHHEVRPRKRPEGACPAVGLPGLIGDIRDLCLDVHSAAKFIPRMYLDADVDQRIALLQGLMDGDGIAARNNPNSVGYSTTSSTLADNVAELVTSLGGTASPSSTNRTAEGKSVEYVLSIMLPTVVAPFHSSRRQSGKKEGRYTRVPRRPIVSIEPVEPAECQCIAVAAEDNLYITGDTQHVVTHNTNTGKTLMLLNIFQRASMVEGQEDLKILFLSLEQTRGDWFERARRIWNFYNLDCEPEKVNEETVRYWRDRFMLVDQNRVSEDQFLRALDDYTRIMGQVPDLVAVDYLGYWAQSFPGNSRYEKISDAVMALKHSAREAGVTVIAPHQVSRGAEFGAHFQIDQGRDSGVIEETADFALSLWATDAMRGLDIEHRTGELGIELGKSRHGGKGQKFGLQFGYLTLTMVPDSDARHRRLARAEAPWASKNTLGWEDAILSHRTGVPPQGFAAIDAMGGP